MPTERNEQPAASTSTPEDFNFLIGNWNVTHHRLSKRLVGDTHWITFNGTMSAKLILGGLGNFDENVLNLPGETYLACTLRLFDPITRTWSIRWIDGRSPDLGDPLTGTFKNGEGTFNGSDREAGRPVLIRFLWSQITPVSARWEQAMSDDSGATWETNWIMEFSRTTESAP
ncbi:hypothetical protein [uncultured Stenotrophomonas sp.]|uniref:hypothetical protein n=1 Tax=uncultured Stenotrophomonas sp. TaxID=165438 RepID=UPI0028EEC8DA|nr:hypothetical protein [uncultured Stenotrophomonas sp.]